MSIFYSAVQVYLLYSHEMKYTAMAYKNIYYNTWGGSPLQAPC